jgi:hypothetical protein
MEMSKSICERSILRSFKMREERSTVILIFVRSNSLHLNSLTKGIQKAQRF